MSKGYNYPVNHNSSGYILNGMIEIRKAVEAGICVLLGLLFCNILPLPKGLLSFLVTVLVCLILGMLGLVGIKGEPLSRYLFFVIRWKLIHKKPYFYNNNNDSHILTAADVYLDAPSLKDSVNEIVEGFRDKFSSTPIEHIEGQTFVFDVDPLMAQLQDAETPDEEEGDNESDEAAASEDELDFDDLF